MIEDVSHAGSAALVGLVVVAKYQAETECGEGKGIGERQMLSGLQMLSVDMMKLRVLTESIRGHACFVDAGRCWHRRKLRFLS